MFLSIRTLKRHVRFSSMYDSDLFQWLWWLSCDMRSRIVYNATVTKGLRNGDSLHCRILFSVNIYIMYFYKYDHCQQIVKGYHRLFINTVYITIYPWYKSDQYFQSTDLTKTVAHRILNNKGYQPIRRLARLHRIIILTPPFWFVFIAADVFWIYNVINSLTKML